MAIPTRGEALEVLRSGRARIDALIGQLADAQIKQRTVLGGGDWSVKDLIGHLAGWEELALGVAESRPPRHASGTFASADDFNAAEIERKRDWTLAKIRKDAQRIRTELLTAIENMDDEQWLSKIPTGRGKGRSTLALVLGRILAGGRLGLFAHDLAHLADLEKSVRRLSKQ